MNKNNFFSSLPGALKQKKVWFPLVLNAFGLFIAVLAIMLFSELAEEILEKETLQFDQAIISAVDGIRSDGLLNVMEFVTELGSVWWISVVSVVTVAFLWFKLRDGWSILFFVIAQAAGGLLTTELKHFFARSRPSIDAAYDAVGYSFPSGHAMGSFLLYGFIGYLIVRSQRSRTTKWLSGTLVFFFIALIGFSRIYLGVHYPSDVLAGYAAGTLWLFVCIFSLEWVLWIKRSSLTLGSFRKIFSSKNS
ncbi:phosphatase PAP2 family protein [Guptibacillus hwajinpoensis]|uniref:phosphatase PAP2 family protein n=1 Tax=Guptibacillus hwajinpoensis TaxID=208199 RepID=UPI001CFEE755|nr:phosphatase PAP2 family protein [Pseudalkalibacillus hwajinpoensis]WLR58482.1 phosphatase PAP2 family protein [Pseudalkalibacillus hwajinpoensis]